MRELNRIVKKIKKSPIQLLMKKIQKPEIGIFSDASFANVNNKSQ